MNCIMVENWIKIILSSAVVSAITSGVATYFIEKESIVKNIGK